MKNKSDILMMNNFVRDLRYTGIGDRDSKRNKIFIKKFPELAEEFQNETFDEISLNSDSDLQGEGVKIIIPSY